MLLFMRHGQSLANARQVFAGQRDDSPLTDEGRAEAAAAAEQLKASGQTIDHIIASPQARTKETAEIVARVLGLGYGQVTYDQRLEEYDMGDITGHPIHPISSAELTAHPESEDPVAFRARVLAGVEAAAALPGITLIISHAGVGRMLEAVRTGIEPRHFYDVPQMPNGAVTELRLH